MKDRYGADYPRLGWAQPLLGAFVLVVASSFVFSVLAAYGAKWASG